MILEERVVPKLTISTATYTRGHLLERLYRSLQKQKTLILSGW